MLDAILPNSSVVYINPPCRPEQSVFRRSIIKVKRDANWIIRARGTVPWLRKTCFNLFYAVRHPIRYAKNTVHVLHGHIPRHRHKASWCATALIYGPITLRSSLPILPRASFRFLENMMMSGPAQNGTFICYNRILLSDRILEALEKLESSYVPNEHIQQQLGEKAYFYLWRR